MSQPRHRQLQRAYVLHHSAYRDTGRILEVLTREHGRLSLFARGVRGPKAKLAALLQPFQPLLVSFSGRSEAPLLTGAEPAGACAALPAASLLGCFYLNELLLKLTTRHDAHPQLFDAYHATLEQLRAGALLERCLRLFEKRLLEEVGYGLDLQPAAAGGGVDPAGWYLFRPAQGLVPTEADAPGAIAGSSLCSLAQERLVSAAELQDARRLLSLALTHCLEGRPLRTRAVARAMLHRGSSA